MTLFAGILKLSAWDSHDTLSLCRVLRVTSSCSSGIGIRWFQWDAR